MVGGRVVYLGGLPLASGVDVGFTASARPFEHGDVLLHGREAHGVVAGQFSDPLRAAQRAQDDVTSGGIGESGEDLVGVEGELH